MAYGDLKRNMNAMKVCFWVKFLLSEATELSRAMQSTNASVLLVLTDLIHHIIVPFSTWCLGAIASFLSTSSFTEKQPTDFQIYAIICFFTLNSN